MKKLSYLLATLSVCLPCGVQSAVPVIPRPVVDNSPLFGKAGQDGFLFNKAVKINAVSGLENETAHLKDILGRMQGGESSSAAGGIIQLSLDPSLDKEAYRLRVKKDLITLVGGSPAGVFYAIQTLKQLLPPQVFSSKKQPLTEYRLADLSIEDKPACGWRGFMLDSSRQFQTKDEVKRCLDLMAVHKLNRFHWHLVDSEGWRLEIRKYPELVKVAKGTPNHYPGEDPECRTKRSKYHFGDFHGEGYYTQKDVQEIVAYAKSRHIEIIPEIEFPGHAMILLTAYPELSTTGKVPVIKSNISPDLMAVNDKSMGFLKDILDETMELFPFDVIHFGGDEAPKGQWRNSPEMQAKIKELGFDGEDREDKLQAWMFNEMTAYIGKKGKRSMGWEEIMHGKNMEILDKKTIIMPWLSAENAIISANNGYGVVHSSTYPFYLDSPQSTSPADNWALYDGVFGMKALYEYPLFPEKMTEEGRRNVLGAQCQLWTTETPEMKHIEYQIYPRLCALSELTWTPGELKDYDHFYDRLLTHTQRLDAMNVHYRYVDPTPCAQWNKEKLTEQIWEVPVKLPVAVFDGKADSYADAVVDFVYTGGSSGLEIKKVELLVDGKVVAEDKHDGFSGAKSRDTAYRLKMDRALMTSKPAAKNDVDVFNGTVPVVEASLRITHGNGEEMQDSTGNILCFTGKGVELFNPQNFKAGDYPSVTWTSGDYTTPEAVVKIPFQRWIDKAGDYELVFRSRESKGKAVIEKIGIQSAKGNPRLNKAEKTLEGLEKKIMLPFSVKASDVNANNYIVFTLNSPDKMAGEARVCRVADLPKVSEYNFSWNPGVFEGGSLISYLKGISPLNDGKMTFSFNYQSGGSGLYIRSVQILKNGEVIAEEIHDGFAGNNPKDNIYTLESPLLKKSEKYDIRVDIAPAGAPDTQGEIEIN